MARILVIDDELSVLSAVSRRLQREGHEVETTDSLTEAKRLIRDTKPFDVIVTDMSMEGEKTGLEVIQTACARDLFAMVVVMTAYGTVENAVESMRRGAYDYIEKNKPGTDTYELLAEKIKAALAQRAEDLAAREQVEGTASGWSTAT